MGVLPTLRQLAGVVAAFPFAGMTGVPDGQGGMATGCTVESTFRVRSHPGHQGPGRRTAGLAVAFRLAESAQQR